MYYCFASNKTYLYTINTHVLVPIQTVKIEEGEEVLW